MFEFRFIAPCRATHARAWLTDILSRVVLEVDLSISGLEHRPDVGFQFSLQWHDYPVPPAISDAGGFCVGLPGEITKDYRWQESLGPVILVSAIPFSVDSTEIRFSFFVSFTSATTNGFQKEATEAWRNITILRDEYPSWTPPDALTGPLLREIVNAPGTNGQALPATWASLSNHDKDIVRQYKSGAPVADIARNLSRDERTINNRLSMLRQTLGEEFLPVRNLKRRDGRRTVNQFGN
jgi:hypothetical protein